MSEPVSVRPNPAEAAQVQLYPNLVPHADVLTRWLTDCVHWRSEEIAMFGKRIKVPRLVAWFGDNQLNYRYSGLPHVAQGWPEELLELRSLLKTTLGIDSNFVLANRYRSGADYMGWHKDDEPALQGPVVSVSFGSTRRFCLEQPGCSQAPKKHQLLLASGSVLVHPKHWRHTLPKTAKPVTERFNLSFRRLQPARK